MGNKLNKENKKKSMNENIKEVIAVLSGKGGVGKTTVAVNLALAFAKQGFKTGILDIDIHGPNVPLMLGIKDAKLFIDENEKIIPYEYFNADNYIKIKVMSTDFLLKDKSNAVIWRGPLKHKLISDFLSKVKWGNLDYLIVDFPPGTGDETISFSQLIKQYFNKEPKAIIVSMPQKLSLADAEKTIDFCKKTDMKIIGLIENLSGIFGKDKVMKLANKYNLNYLGSIELSEKIVKESEESKVTVKETFINLAKKIDEIIKEMEKQTKTNSH